MKEIIKTYKSEQSLINQQGFFRLCNNQIRKNKSTLKFKRINTTKYSSLLQEMYEYNDNEYICAGLNSFEREVVVVDNDDETFGKSTMNALKRLGLEPHCQKVKNNGHSQTYFFIDKYIIGAAGFFNGKYWENDDYVNHEKWKRLTKMMNYLFNGDLGYTGYNCQNPLYVNANVTSYRSIQKKYSFDDLYDFCLNELSDIKNLDEFLKRMRKQSMMNSKTKKENNNIKIIYRFLNQSNINQSIITNGTAEAEAEVDVEATIANAVAEVERTINEQIFISCSQTCKSFHFNNKLDYANYEYIAKTCYNDYTDSYFAYGYTTEELINRIRANVRQIIYNDKVGKMQWNKVGYTKKQRQLSLKIRQEKHKQKLYTVQSIITNGTVSIRKIKSEYEKITNENIGIGTINRILKEIEQIKHNQSNTVQSIITNGTVSTDDTKYIENLAFEALKIRGNNNGSKIKRKKTYLLSNRK